MANPINTHLDNLAAVNKDAEAGFLHAASNVRNTETESLFNGYAKQHGKFATEIEAEVERLGWSPSDSRTLGGSIHRGWMDLKAALTGHSVRAMLTSCQSGEQSAESAYLDAVNDIKSGQTHTLIEKHLQQINEIRTHLASLVGEVKDGVEFPTNE